MNLEDIMLKETNQSHKEKYCMIPLIRGTRLVKFIETKGRMVVTSAWGEVERRLV